MTLSVAGQYSRRNTKTYAVSVGDLVLYFSYGTCIAVWYPPLRITVRARNAWGPTTGRHMREWSIVHWEQIEPDEIEDYVGQAIRHLGMASMKEQLGGEAA